VSLILSLIIFHGGQTVTPPNPKPVTETYIVTAYTAHCDGCSGITASGRPPMEGVTVACPKSMKLGTWVDIENVGRRRCDDRGGAIKDKRLDLFIPSYDAAVRFGRRELEVEILKEEN